MGGDNMESLLLQNDDSSSGESDAEEAALGNAALQARQQSSASAVPAAAAAAAPSVAVVPPATPPLQQQQPPAAQQKQQQPIPQTTKPPVGTSQSEMAARLKSMYSPATKSNLQTSKPTAATIASQAPAPSKVLPQQQQPHIVAPVSIPTQLTKSQTAPMQPLPSPAQYRRGSSGGGGAHMGAPMKQPQISQQSSGHASAGHHRSNIASSGGIPHQMPLPQHQKQPGGGGGGGGQSRQRAPTAQTQQQPTTMPPAFAPRGGITQASSAGGIKLQQQQQHGGVSDPFEPTPVSTIIERSKFASQQQSKTHQQQQQQQQQQQHMQTPTTGPSSMSGSNMGSSSQRGNTSSGYRPSQQQPVGSMPGPTSSSIPGSALVSSTGSGMQLSSGTSSLSGAAQMSRADKEREMKKYKERFLIFTRVLMKYLEQKDVVLHAKVKAIIKDCAERNKRQEPGYESVTASMRTRLKAVVHENYWKRAEAYLDHFLKDKAKSGSSTAMALVSGGTSSSGAGVPGISGTSAGATTGNSGAYHDKELARRKLAESLRLQQQQQQQQSSSASSRPSQPVTSSSSSLPTQSDPKASAAQQEPVGKKRGSVSSTASNQSGKPSSKGSATAAKKTTSKARSSKGASSAAQQRKTSIGSTTSTGGTKQQQPPPQPQQPSITSAAVETPTPQQSLPPVAAPVSTPQQSPPPAPKPLPPPVREYNEFMELVDHAVHYDWTVAGLLMEKEQPEILSKEQKALLLEIRTSISATPSSGLEHKMDSSTDQPDTTETSFPVPGWSKQNVLSSRTAWALLRLPEETALILQAKKSNPAVGNGLPSLPTTPSSSQPEPPSSPSSDGLNYEHAWYNEEKAEEDKVLAVLSEGLQIYLRGVLEKAVHCARQRYNVDGIRLWHQQTAMALKAKAVAKENSKLASSSNKENASGTQVELPAPPPLTLRLGCDVTRQIAQAAGNAAMTVKRMEEALERQPGVPSRDLFSAETETSCLLKASSMSELALLPKLGKAVSDADLAGKRSFEIYGGKYSTEPPLGRIPKQPKLEVVDFQMGMSFARTGGKRRNRAGTVSSSFYF